MGNESIRQLLRRHWPIVAGAALLLWHGLRALIGIASDIEYVVELFRDPGWVRTMTQFLVDPPNWVTLIAVAIGLLLIVWDLWFRPKEKVALPTPPIPVPAKAPVNLAKGLYVGSMHVSLGDLTEDGFIEISARCFNGTGQSVFIHRATGAITASESFNGSSADIGRLPTPLLVQDRSKTERIGHLEEFLLILEQRVPKEIAAKILSVTDGHRIGFDLETLNVLIGAHDSPGQPARLPLWNGISLARPKQDIQVSRIIYATAHMTISAAILPGQSPLDTEPRTPL